MSFLANFKLGIIMKTTGKLFLESLDVVLFLSLIGDNIVYVNYAKFQIPTLHRFWEKPVTDGRSDKWFYL